MAIKVVVDDRASAICDIVSDTEFEEFESQWSDVLPSQGIELSRTKSLLDKPNFDLLQNKIRRGKIYVPTKREIEDYLVPAINKLSKSGIYIGGTARVKLCIGGNFDGQTVGNQINISIDSAQTSELEQLLIHELGHIAIRESCMSALPLPFDRQLWSEAVAVRIARYILGGSKENAVAIDADKYRDYDAHLDDLKDAFRLARLGKASKEESIPDHPFISYQEKAYRFSRYGYVLAAEMLQNVKESELSKVVSEPVLACQTVRDYLNLATHEEAGILNVDGSKPVAPVSGYAKSSLARHLSWEGRFPSISAVKFANTLLPIDFGSVLDVGCGTGHTVEHICKDSTLITGVDQSEEMLSFAKRRDISADWVCSDYLDWNSDREFSLVVSFFDTVNYLAQQASIESVIEKLTANLASSGVLIFDFITLLGAERAIKLRTWDESGWKLAELTSYFPSEALLKIDAYMFEEHGNRIYHEQHKQSPIPTATVQDHLVSLKYTKIFMRDFSNFKKPCDDKTTRALVIAQK